MRKVLLSSGLWIRIIAKENTWQHQNKSFYILPVRNEVNSLHFLYLFPNLISLTMKVFSVVFFAVLFSAVTAGGKLKKLKKEVESLKSAFSSVLEDTEGAIAKITARINTLEAERVELDQAHAWQALHMAAAAACRGSTPTGGSGPNGNVDGCYSSTV